MASNINIGRQGWAGVALEAAPGTPTSPTDYVPFTTNTLFGMVKNEPISQASQDRQKNFSSVPIEKWGAGDMELYADPKFLGYFVVGALGSPATVALGGGAFQHTITVKDSNSNPQTLTIINDRQGSTDQEAYYSSVVDQLQFTITEGIGMAKATLLSLFPQTTTSGTATTTSGTIYAHPSARFAFGANVATADQNALSVSGNLKPHEFQFTVKNNAKAVFRHGNLNPDSINVGDFEAEASFKLYFENATDRNTYYNSSKQAAEFALLGNPIAGSSFSESTKFRWYQTRIDTFALETGLSNFYVEDVKLIGEQDQNTGNTMDAVIVNSKTLYI